MSKRPIDDERIADWVDGEMDDIQRSRFEAELRVNPQLRAAAEAYRTRVFAIRQALRGDESLGSDFTDRVMAATVGERETRRWRLVPMLASALAASLLVGVWFVAQRLGTSTATTESDSLATAPSAKASRPEDLEDFEGAFQEGTEKAGAKSDSSLPPIETRAGLPVDELKEEGFLQVPRDGLDPAVERQLRRVIQEPSSAEAPKMVTALIDSEPARESAAEAFRLQVPIETQTRDGDRAGLARGLEGALRDADEDAKGKVFFLDGGVTGGVPAPNAGLTLPDATKPRAPGTRVAGEDFQNEVPSPLGGREGPSLRYRALPSDLLGALVYLVEVPAAEIQLGAVSASPMAFDLGLPLTPVAVRFDLSKDAAGSAPPADAPGAYVAQPGDEVYALAGDAAQVDTALAKLAQQVRQRSARLSVRRTFTPLMGATPRQPEPEAKSRESDDVTRTSRETEAARVESPTWIVVRRLPRIVPSPGGPSSPGPSGPSSPGPAGSPPPPTSQPKKSSDGKPK